MKILNTQHTNTAKTVKCHCDYSCIFQFYFNDCKHSQWTLPFSDWQNNQIAVTSSLQLMQKYHCHSKHYHFEGNKMSLAMVKFTTVNASQTVWMSKNQFMMEHLCIMKQLLWFLLLALVITFIGWWTIARITVIINVNVNMCLLAMGSFNFARFLDWFVSIKGLIFSNSSLSTSSCASLSSLFAFPHKALNLWMPSSDQPLFVFLLPSLLVIPLAFLWTGLTSETMGFLDPHLDGTHSLSNLLLMSIHLFQLFSKIKRTNASSHTVKIEEIVVASLLIFAFNFLACNCHGECCMKAKKASLFNQSS